MRMASPADYDDEAVAELDGMVHRKWIKNVPSKTATKRFVRGRLVVSKLVVIKKDKIAKDKDGTQSHNKDEAPLAAGSK